MGQPVEEFRKLASAYNMAPHHFHKDKRGFIIVTRQGIDYLQAHLGIVVTFETVLEWSDPEAGRYVIKATGTMARKDGSPHVISSFGETSKANNTNPYPVAMCEKRALSRVVLKLVGMYELGAVGEDEL
jgi:hypothetical protein